MHLTSSQNSNWILCMKYRLGEHYSKFHYKRRRVNFKPIGTIPIQLFDLLGKINERKVSKDQVTFL